MYQPSSPCAPQVVLVFFGLYAITLVPGGARGVAEKLKLPKRYAWAESLGLLRAERSRFKVRLAWLTSKSY